MNKVFIYKITSPTGKVYVGSTTNLKSRMEDYEKMRNKRQQKIFHSIQKHGWSSHKVDVILITDITHRAQAECLLGLFFNCLNKKTGLNLQLPKIGDSLSMSEETKTRIGLANKGRAPSKLAIERSIACRKLNPMKQEARDRIRDSRLGKKLSPEAKAKISKLHLGKTVSKETREKQSLAKAGKIITQEELQRMLKGRALMRKPEHIRNAQLSRMKPVVHLATGVFYDSLAEAAVAFGRNRRVLGRMLNNQSFNRTQLIYA